jgi:hypothetical protein
MDSVAIHLNFLSPLHTRDHTLASQDELMEVYQSSEEIYITRNQISDVAFILPIQEVESGRFFLYFSENSFVIRYSYENNHMIPWATSFYFSWFGVQPLGVRLFHASNTLLDYLRRSMCHRPESETMSQSFKLPMFSPESFYYLAFKLADKSIHLSIHQKQQSIKYYNSLKMESTLKQSTFSYLRILCKPGLKALQNILGNGVGLGLATTRLTKERPISYCKINSIFTCIECGDLPPNEIIHNPQLQCRANGISLTFPEQNRILSCHVRFQNIAVRSPADVI